MEKILVIEDEKDIQEVLENFLKAEHYDVIIANDGVEGITQFMQNSFDLVLLDILLPKIDGYGVCEVIRKESNIPIVMLTALDSEDHQIKGFDLQVDDYITKPFSMPILLRKIAAILRRTSTKDKPPKRLIYKDLILDLESYQAYMYGNLIELTVREFELIREFLTNTGKVLTRQMLLNRLWKYDFLGDERIVDTHIKNLRKKLEVNYIETIRGVGYRVNP